MTKPKGLTKLLSLQAQGKHVYTGNTPASTTASRRAANKRAKASRKANRKNA